MPPDVEPLYQYINTAEFLRETEEGGVKLGECEDRGRGQSQLALARQLLMRRLWCEQPDVINSGILKLLTDEERKLQEVRCADFFFFFFFSFFKTKPHTK